MQTEIETLPKTNFLGSERNFLSVKQQISDRFGKEVAEEYDPLVNCRTYNDWKRNNFLVNYGAKSLKSVVIVEKKDKITGKVIKKYPKTICLFFKNQVHKVE
ncbi:MAG: hypothetical protein NTZ87_02930 [Candidatus Nomurabacteria bacterium]|nr:hypothetical protein [Candidatus Nomurabacteria bacterium]